MTQVNFYDAVADEPIDNRTYPDIQPLLLQKAKEYGIV